MTKSEFLGKLESNRDIRNRLGDPYGTYSNELEALCLQYIESLEREIELLQKRNIKN